MYRSQRVEPGRGLLLISLLLPGLLAGGAFGQRGEAEPRDRTSPEARKALAAAGKLGRIPRGTELAERRTRLEQALAAFEELAERFRSEPKVVAEAAFRQGQILGRLGRTDAAVQAFDRAAMTDADAFGARAPLEAGHVLRREKRFPDALQCYRRSAAATAKKYPDQARIWVGKTLVRLGRVPEAREIWAAVGADGAADPGVRIDAFDELAMSHVRDKRIVEAKRVLRDAEDSLVALTAGESKAAKALRGRLDRMRARKSIAKAEAKAADQDRR